MRRISSVLIVVGESSEVSVFGLGRLKEGGGEVFGLRWRMSVFIFCDGGNSGCLVIHVEVLATVTSKIRSCPLVNQDKWNKSCVRIAGTGFCYSVFRCDAC